MTSALKPIRKPPRSAEESALARRGLCPLPQGLRIATPLLSRCGIPVCYVRGDKTPWVPVLFVALCRVYNQVSEALRLYAGVSNSASDALDVLSVYQVSGVDAGQEGIRAATGALQKNLEERLRYASELPRECD